MSKEMRDIKRQYSKDETTYKEQIEELKLAQGKEIANIEKDIAAKLVEKEQENTILISTTKEELEDAKNKTNSSSKRIADLKCEYENKIVLIKGKYSEEELTSKVK